VSLSQNKWQIDSGKKKKARWLNKPKGSAKPENPRKSWKHNNRGKTSKENGRRPGSGGEKYGQIRERGEAARDKDLANGGYKKGSVKENMNHDSRGWTSQIRSSGREVKKQKGNF